jgi:transposase
VLASVDQGRGLSVGAPSASRYQNPCDAASGRTSSTRRGPAYAYNIKALRDREMAIAAQAERTYEHFVAQWKPRRPKTGARAPQLGKTQ